jgi:hypothetical protein
MNEACPPKNKAGEFRKLGLKRYMISVIEGSAY